MKANSKKVQAYKYNKAQEIARQKRQEMLNKMTDEERTEFLNQEKIRQENSLKQASKLLSLTNTFGGTYSKKF